MLARRTYLVLRCLIADSLHFYKSLEYKAHRYPLIARKNTTKFDAVTTDQSSYKEFWNSTEKEVLISDTTLDKRHFLLIYEGKMVLWWWWTRLTSGCAKVIVNLCELILLTSYQEKWSQKNTKKTVEHVLSYICKLLKNPTFPDSTDSDIYET